MGSVHPRAQGNQGPKLSTEQNRLREKQALVAFGKSMAEHGTTIAVDEYSASFLGHKAMISSTFFAAARCRGRFQNDGNDHAKGAVATLVFGKAGAEEAEAGKSKSKSKMFADMLIEQVVTAGLAFVENDVIMANIDIKGGRMILTQQRFKCVR